ncbi:uncharacterized protein LOC131639219 [Vicia villosa]|uniref:uncharacterized protein LOC131639219 n=1 Tax=Vicia villosa TaxID=3911 RepID=UPI00273ACF70|nr:uncharacterized protein LOC131639219 [Vicia villosa]
MIVGTFNIRGGGSLIKRKWINSIIANGKTDMFLLQEIKFKVVSDSVAKSFWGMEDIGFSYSGEDGMSGGVFTLWKIQSVSVISSFRGNGYLGNKIFVGDFYAVKKRNERVGQALVRSNVEWRKFSDFIEESGLVDVPSKGKKFSWFSRDEKSNSRLDRFLVSVNIVSLWGVVGEDWGPKSSKFHNEWFSDKGFIPFVEKFRLIKERLKWGNKTIFGKYDMEVEEGVRDFNASDDRKFWDEEAHEIKVKVNKRVWLNLKIKEDMLIKNSRLKWLNDGDNHSKFFHKVMKDRKSRNHFSPIITSKGVVNSVREVKDAVKVPFIDKFKEDYFDTPSLDGIFINSLSREDSLALEVPFL